MYAREFFLRTLSPSHPKNNVPKILNKPIIARAQPAILTDIPLETKSFGKCNPIKVTWKPQVKNPNIKST